MWEFRKGNTFGATVFGSCAAFRLPFAAYVQFVVAHPPTTIGSQ
jgi:succinate-acetate transporter protein